VSTRPSKFSRSDASVITVAAPPSRDRPGTGPLPMALPLAVATQLVLFALGALLAIYGALLVPRGPRFGGTVLSLGVLIAIVGNVAGPWLGRAVAGRLGGIAPAGGWLLAALALATSRPAGSVILPGGGDLALPALLFLVLGVIAGAVGAATGPRAWRR